MANHPDYLVRGSGGTTSGQSRWHALSNHTRRERTGAEAPLWRTLGPPRLSIINRTANLFTDGGDRYRARRGAREELRVAPGANPTTVSAERWLRAIERLRAHAPRQLGGDPQFLIQIARTIERTRVRLPSLDGVVLGNHFGWSFQRRAITTALSVPARSLYHSSEASTMALECPLGRWHLLESYAHYEIVRGGAAVSAGGLGLVAVTTFDNPVRPLFRYLIGDLGRIVPGPCPCGDPTRCFELAGRTAYCFRDGRGRWVTPRAIDALLGDQLAASHLQVLRDDDGLSLRVVGAPRVDRRVVERVADELALQVRWLDVPSLPLASAHGKLALFDVPPPTALEHALRTSTRAPFRPSASLPG